MVSGKPTGNGPHAAASSASTGGSGRPRSPWSRPVPGPPRPRRLLPVRALGAASSRDRPSKLVRPSPHRGCSHQPATRPALSSTLLSAHRAAHRMPTVLPPPRHAHRRQAGPQSPSTDSVPAAAVTPPRASSRPGEVSSDKLTPTQTTVTETTWPVTAGRFAGCWQQVSCRDTWRSWD